MKDFQLSAWTARNPLGIIALFITLIYAMSVLLLGLSVHDLTSFNQTLLVFFIVLFPVVVLSVFAWLVVSHHKKLYSPGDFRSDEAFNATSNIPPEELGRRLSRELEIENKDKQILENREPSEVGQPVEKSETEIGNQGETTPLVQTLYRQAAFARAYMAEGLVFQELQREFGGAVKREVRISTPKGIAVIDGLIETQRETIAVEVKLARDLGQLKKIIKPAWLQIGKYTSILNERYSNVHFILAIVVEFDDEILNIEEMMRQWLEERNNVRVRVFYFNELLTKYGLPVVEKKK
jgi:hypothetical protein